MMFPIGSLYILFYFFIYVWDIVFFFLRIRYIYIYIFSVTSSWIMWQFSKEWNRWKENISKVRRSRKKCCWGSARGAMRWLSTDPMWLWICCKITGAVQICNDKERMFENVQLIGWIMHSVPIHQKMYMFWTKFGHLQIDIKYFFWREVKLQGWSYFCRNCV